MRWEELGRETGAEYYPVYYLRWNPYEFLKPAGNSTSIGTATIDGRLCQIIEADVDIDAWGNGTGWVTDRTSVRIVIYADAGSYLPLHITVLWREKYPQGTTEYPYVIGISYDDTIIIEPPEDVLSIAELQDITSDLNSEIEERAGELVRILNAFKESNGFFPEILDRDTVSNVMQAAGLEWPVNPVTGSPISDGDFIPGYYCYRSLDDGSDYDLAVCSYYSCSRFTYHGLPEEPTIIPWLTDEQKERALEIALADPRVQEILEGKLYDTGAIGPNHMGSKLLGAMVNIDLKEPCIIEFDWPFSITDDEGCMIEAGTRHETAGVETLWIRVNLEAGRVVGIQPLSFRVFN